MHEHEAGESVEAKTPEAPVIPAVAALTRQLQSGRPAGVMALQRTAGNAAVNRLLGRRPSARVLARESINSKVPAGFSLDDIILSIGLPANAVLHSTTFADMKTSAQGATVTVRVSPTELRLYFSGIWVEGALVERTYVRSVRIGLSGNYIIPEVERSGKFGLDKADKIWLDLHAYFKEALAGVLTGGAGYNLYADPDPAALGQKVIDAFAKKAGGGASPFSADDVKVYNAGVRVRTTSEINKEADGAGIVIPSGTAIGLMVYSGGTTIGKLKEAGGGAQDLFNAANVKSVRLTSNGITVVKDGEPVASVTEVTLSGGVVKVTGIELLGKAKEYAETEQGLLALGSLFGGLAHGLPPELALRKTVLDNPHAVIVPGITRSKIERALQAALNEYVEQNGSTIGGVDLSSVLGAPAPAK